MASKDLCAQSGIVRLLTYFNAQIRHVARADRMFPIGNICTIAMRGGMGDVLYFEGRPTGLERCRNCGKWTCSVAHSVASSGLCAIHEGMRKLQGRYRANRWRYGSRQRMPKL